MSIYSHKNIGGILLVAGTSIGAGMLALPLSTGVAGFFPSMILFVVCFAYMLLSLFLLLEANLYSTELEANIISMAQARLGGIGQVLAWSSFMLLLYAAVAAYCSAGGSLIAKLVGGTIHYDMSPHAGATLFVIVFGLVIFCGTTLVDYLNRVLMIGLLISYLSLALFVSPHVKWSHLTVENPSYLWAAVPIVILSFTSHIILPSLRTYLGNNLAHLKKVLLVGSVLPLLCYVVWQFVVIGVLPTAHLVAISTGAHPIASLTSALKKDLGLVWIAFAVGSFSFFALVTSFLGAALSLCDFLADGFQIKKTTLGRVMLIMLTLLPPYLFALYFPKGFMIALSYAGVFVAVLYGILPPWMVWKARYVERLPAPFHVKGGKPVLLLCLAGGLCVIGFQIAAVFHWLPSI